MYYTRICTPKKLVKLGFPFDFKISLRTKNRPDALRRNLIIVPIVSQSLDKWVEIAAINDDTINEYKTAFLQSIDEIWHAISHSDKQQLANIATLRALCREVPPTQTASSKLPLKHWLSEFIHSKQQRNITMLTVHQPNQRISHFIAFYDNHANVHSSQNGPALQKS